MKKCLLTYLQARLHMKQPELLTGVKVSQYMGGNSQYMRYKGNPYLQIDQSILMDTHHNL